MHAHYASEYATTIQWPCLHLLTLHDSLLTLALPLTMSSSNFRLRMTSRRLLSHMMFPWPFVIIRISVPERRSQYCKKADFKSRFEYPNQPKANCLPWHLFANCLLEHGQWKMEQGSGQSQSFHCCLDTYSSIPQLVEQRKTAAPEQSYHNLLQAETAATCLQKNYCHGLMTCSNVQSVNPSFLGRFQLVWSCSGVYIRSSLSSSVHSSPQATYPRGESPKHVVGNFLQHSATRKLSPRWFNFCNNTKTNKTHSFIQLTLSHQSF